MEKIATPTLIPVVREIPADLETPISVYLKLAGNGPSFLLESVTGGEYVSRYSFLGTDLCSAFILKDDQWEIMGDDQAVSIPIKRSQTPLQVLRDHLGMGSVSARDTGLPGLPRFSGGLVGYLGFETVRYFEPTLPLVPHPDLPEAIFLRADTVIAFDHAYGKLLLIANAHSEAEIPAAEARLDDLVTRLDCPLPELDSHASEITSGELQSNVSFEE